MELDGLAALAGPAAAGYVAATSVLLTGEPLILRVDGPAPGHLVRAAAEQVRVLPTVGVLVGDPSSVPPELAAAADICLATTAAAPRPWVAAPVDPVVSAVAARPLACLALVALLRANEHQSTWDATGAEAATYGMLLGGEAHRAWLHDRGPASVRAQPGPPVAVTRSGPVLDVALNRPSSRNAFDSGLRDGLVEALAVAEIDPTIEQVRLTGRGPCFSAGGDLREFGSVPDGATAFGVRMSRHPGRAVHAVADRTTALLHGPCVGAGIEVPAFAGQVIADPAATFRLPEVSMGLVPGAGGTVSIARRVGRQRTGWLALTGSELSAPDAHDWGLVDALRRRDWTD